MITEDTMRQCIKQNKECNGSQKKVRLTFLALKSNGLKGIKNVCFSLNILNNVPTVLTDFHRP